MGCMANADFVMTSGILGAAGARVGLRRRWPSRRGKVSDEETARFLASLEPVEEGSLTQVRAGS